MLKHSLPVANGNLFSVAIFPIPRPCQKLVEIHPSKSCRIKCDKGRLDTFQQNLRIAIKWLRLKSR